MSTAVSFHQVTKHFGDLIALDNVSFDIPKGSFFALLGPNGAGKSTLINAMAGLTVPTSGHIQVCGKDVIASYQDTRANLGLVPQEIISDPFFTVQELLTFQSGYFGKVNNADWIEELLTRLHLWDKRKASVHELSGGMKRRVLIAMALVHNPGVLVLDEPTAGVDIDLRRVLWNFARELHAEGKTIILTTHYLEEAEKLCEQVAILNDGKLLTYGAMSDLINRHPFLSLKITLSDSEDNTTPQWPEVWAKRLSKDASSAVGYGVKTYYFDVPQKETVNDLLNWVTERNLSIQDFSLNRPPLEKIFVDMVS